MESSGVVAKIFGFENEYMLATPLAVEEQCIRYSGPVKEAVYTVLVELCPKLRMFFKNNIQL